MQIYLTPICTDALETTRFISWGTQVYLSVLQWTIMAELTIQLHWKEVVDSIPINKNPWVRGWSCLLGSVSIAWVMALMCRGINEMAWPWASNDDKWHHVMSMATAPLQPLVLLALYTNNLRDCNLSLWKRALARTAIIFVGTVVWYFVQHFIRVR